MADITLFTPYAGGSQAQNIVTSSASSSVTVAGIGRGKADAIRVANVGSNPAWIAVGSSGLLVTTSAGIAIPAGAVEMFGVGQDSTLAAVSSSGSATTLNVVSGNGM